MGCSAPDCGGKVVAQPPKGGERSEPVSRIVFKPYDTESKPRNVLASPLGEEGHEVAKGCTRVRMIMILDMDVTAERRHYNTHRPPKGETTHYILCTASLRGPPIGGQDRDGASYRCSAPYTLSRFAGLRPGGKHVTGFSGRFALLQIQFLCHLKGKRENRWHWILCHI